MDLRYRADRGRTASVVFRDANCAVKTGLSQIGTIR